eukprot:CAMPEP_0176444056 /NCGR_PEP_ID=MMETSP0127-20121128/22823_1 /TAXON_ID=938130 /ORGANISM="Platyophrya macrostoma, Strain WH" /LENGTH=127 /DNA_ID=CAMNT_0017829467 /DNA_START=34 /DNA_END=417 /DNA_ORIENTATION=-
MQGLSKWLFKPVTSSFTRSLTYSEKRFYHINPLKFGEVQENPGLTAKRCIKAIGERLRKIDPARWDPVPITFKTHFRDEEGYADIATSIHIHEALEKEFSIDIKDRHIMITDVETAFYVVMKSHDAI